MSDQKYLDLVATGMFAPIIKARNLKIGEDDMFKGIGHGILSVILGWTALAWFFVGRYRFTQFLHGDYNSPARVFAYENNLLFMIYAMIVLFGLLWLLPTLLQALLNRIVHGKGSARLKLSFTAHAFTATSFTYLFLPIIVIFTAFDAYSWRLIIPEPVEIIIKIIFFALILYGFICAAYRSKVEFDIPTNLSAIHLWIPIVLIIAQLALQIV